MTTVLILAAAALCIITAGLHFASIAIALYRFRKRTAGESLVSRSLPPASLIRPVCGIDNYAAETLRSTFELDYPCCEILFCVASAKDPVVPLVESLIAEHSDKAARLLIGDDRISTNPKLNNVIKGWRAASHEWIIIADSNVLMPPDYIQRLLVTWQEDTGLVASPPIGCRPLGFWAEIECAFLNTYEARWQYVADTLGFGFAQGKTMLWRHSDLERAGGIEMLANEVAEDAASTKVVRGAGLQVRLVDRPFAQPLGKRRATEVWNRQLRWARLRRASFLHYFLPEALSGSLLPMLLLGIATYGLGGSPLLSVPVLAVLWYGSEMVLATVAGWHLSLRYPLYCIVRDLMLPALFFTALGGHEFVWRGNEMQVERVRMRPRRMMARMRPRLTQIAPVARRRLRSLRARISSSAILLSDDGDDLL